MRRLALCAALALAALAAPARAQTIAAAHYSAPTTRYDHGVLGDAIEYGALVITLTGGRTVTLRLPETRVFEDTAPRLLDVDGDGAPEVVVVESSLTQGARLAIYDSTGLIAATPYIGQTRRWLAPLGAADLDGDGMIELAYIDRPHLAKILRIWRFEDGALSHVIDIPGLTNYRIGQDFISGGIRRCAGAAPQIIAASADWSRVIATRLDPAPHQTDLGAYTGPAALAAALRCP